MIFITVGVFILVVSFVLALISLVREQRAVGGQVEDNVDQMPILNQDQGQEDQNQMQVQDTAQTANGQYPMTNAQIKSNKQNQVQPREPFFWERLTQDQTPDESEVRRPNDDQPLAVEVPEVPQVSQTLSDAGLEFSQNQSPLKGEFSIQDLVAKRQKDKSPS